MNARKAGAACAVAIALALTACRGWASEPAVEANFILQVAIQVGDGAPVPVGWERHIYSAADCDGQPAQLVATETKIVLKAFGAEVTMLQSSKEWSTLDHKPLRLEFRMGPEGKEQLVTATFLPDRVKYERITDGKSEAGEVTIPAGVSLEDPEMAWKPDATPVGDPVVGWEFDPASLKIEKITLTCKGREDVDIDGKPVSLWRVQVDSESLGPVPQWVDDGGLIWKNEVSLGGLRFILWRTDNPTIATDDAGKTGPLPIPDIATGTAVDGGVEIPKARACRKMRVIVGGLDREGLFVQDQRQVYQPPERDGNGLLSAELEVVSEQAPEFGPPVGSPVPKTVRQYLAATATIESGDPEMLAKAREIVGDETDSWKAAVKIGEWVRKTMEVSFDQALLRSSREVLHEPKGVCRDYAALYCGLARAAGIPCRIAAGAVYIGPLEGKEFATKFGFHAWDEVWVGRWVAIDTAVPSSDGVASVDATHIKFVEGDIRDLASAARVIRSLTLRVLGADTLKPKEEPHAGLLLGPVPRGEEITPWAAAA